MALISKLKGAFRRTPKSPDDLAADAEARRVQDEVQTSRLAMRSGSAGENYQSGRGSRP
jgi:hypothetical protein